MFFNKINTFKIIIFTLITLILATILLFAKTNCETNLLNTILPVSVFNDENVVKITDKSNSLLKVVFEAPKQEDLINLKSEFFEKIDKSNIEIIDFDFSSLLNYYLKHPTNFLSPKYRGLIKEGQYNSIADKAIFALYNPVEVQLVDYEHDPFFLLSDYLKYIGWFHSIHHSVKSNEKNKKDDFLKLDKNDIESDISFIKGDKYYDCQLLRIKNVSNLSVINTNKCIGELIKIQKELTNDKQSIYLAGTPIHAYYTSRNSALTINIICMLSIILVVTLTWFYFKNIFVFVPVALSILFGFLSGFAVTKIWFNDFHIITLLFATTLIGIGIDYSYHYLFHENRGKDFIKHLSYSALTTILAFLILYFTNIELLQQISVFTIFGLFAIYCFVLFIYPCIDLPKPIRSVNFKIHKYVKYGVLGFISILAFIGFFRFRVDDSIAAFYSPNHNLKKAEMIYNNVSNMPVVSPRILKVKGENMEDTLQKEEKITQELDNNNIDYIAISKFIPSIKRQRENFNLVQKLYHEKLFVFNGFLSSEQMNTLKHGPFKYSDFDIKNFGLFRELMLAENENILFVYSNKLPNVDGEELSPIDINSVVSRYLKLYRNVLLVLFPLIFAMVFVVLSIAYKSKKALKIIFAPIMAIIASLGMASLFGVKMNMFSLIALFLILGFTMDYSIFRVGGDNKSEDAILISCITTSFSFLALSFTSFKLISSLSFILFLGISISYILGRLFWVEDTEQI